METIESVIDLSEGYPYFDWMGLTMKGECILILLGCVLLAILSVFFVMKIIELNRKLKNERSLSVNDGDK